MCYHTCLITISHFRADTFYLPRLSRKMSVGWPSAVFSKRLAWETVAYACLRCFSRASLRWSLGTEWVAYTIHNTENSASGKQLGRRQDRGPNGRNVVWRLYYTVHEQMATTLMLLQGSRHASCFWDSIRHKADEVAKTCEQLELWQEVTEMVAYHIRVRRITPWLLKGIDRSKKTEFSHRFNGYWS